MGGGRRSQARRKKAYLIFVVVFLISATGVGTTSFAYQRLSVDYRADMVKAQAGMQQLKQAITAIETLQRDPLNEQTVDLAQKSFTGALTTFQQLEQSFAAFPGIASIVPVYGAQLDTAMRLISIAVDLSQAGVSGCAILLTFISAYRASPGVQGSGINGSEWAAISAHFQVVNASLAQVIGEVDQLQPGDVEFVPHLGSMLATFQKELPTLQVWLADGESLMGALPTLLGINSPTNYLIELLDSTELRPTGGFIGNVGIATFAQGKLSSVHITDVDLLDKPFEFSGHRIPYPAAYRWFSHYLSQGTWLLRDSNLDADFPTAARYSELNYQREGGKLALQGVISITPALIEQLMEITGPIYVPEYRETVTAQNLVDRIHYYQLGAGIGGSDALPAAGGHSSLRKRFTELLAEHFFARLRQLPSSALPRYMQVLAHAIYTKDLQFYFNAGAAENLLSQQHIDGAIQSPAADSLFIVDTNVGGDKANSYITSTLNDQVRIDPQGDAIHQTTITYAWTLPGPIYGRSPYQDYVRIYIPPGAILQSQQGWEPQGTSESFGRQEWAGYFALTFRHARTITLTWTVPGAAKFPLVNWWNYHYLIQRQAGSRWTVRVHIAFPSSCVAVSTTGGLAIGKPSQASLTTSLNQDEAMSIEYMC